MMLEVILFIANMVLVGIAVAMSVQLTTNLRRGKAPTYHSEIGHDTDLPSVSVCIPARNEAHALTACLEHVLASDYERLEVIVFDDVSGDDTSALIKSFAHEGVRFVKGSPIENGWLGKNHALQGLLQQASGSYILFVDVDTRLSPGAIQNMVRYALSHRSAMVSVIPRREDGWRASVLASTLRYFWELIFQRPLSPGSASSAWLIRREVLQRQFDGFTELKAVAQPEAHIAAILSKTNEYRLLVGTHDFGVSYEKKWRSQLITSARLIFPLLGGQVALSIIAALDLLALLIPFVAVAVLWPLHLITTGSAIVSFAVCIAFCALYGRYTHAVWRRGWLIGALLWPLIVLQELILVIASTLQYKRKTVTWKGRRILPEA